MDYEAFKAILWVTLQMEPHVTPSLEGNIAFIIQVFLYIKTIYLVNVPEFPLVSTWTIRVTDVLGTPGVNSWKQTSNMLPNTWLDQFKSLDQNPRTTWKALLNSVSTWTEKNDSHLELVWFFLTVWQNKL
jgi:hypothetical protein